jgi:hypothetical protein
MSTWNHTELVARRYGELIRGLQELLGALRPEA